MLLSRYLDTEPQDIPLIRLDCPVRGGPHAPAVKGQPVHFSVSHSAGLGLLGFAATPVGVDVEEVPRPGTVEEIAAMLHPRETAELAGYEDADRPHAFARAWARKEAYLKGLGTGLARGLSTDYLGTAQVPGADLPGWRIGDADVGDHHRGGRRRTPLTTKGATAVRRGSTQGHRPGGPTDGTSSTDSAPSTGTAGNTSPHLFR